MEIEKSLRARRVLKFLTNFNEFTVYSSENESNFHACKGLRDLEMFLDSSVTSFQAKGYEFANPQVFKAMYQGNNILNELLLCNEANKSRWSGDRRRGRKKHWRMARKKQFVEYLNLMYSPHLTKLSQNQNQRRGSSRHRKSLKYKHFPQQTRTT